jgi:hypothetical protein
MNEDFINNLIHKFANKVILYFHLKPVSLYQENYPIYYIEDRHDRDYTVETMNFLYRHLYHYYLYYADVLKVKKLHIPLYITEEQMVELRQMAKEIEENIQPINRQIMKTNVLGEFYSKTLVRVKREFKRMR